MVCSPAGRVLSCNVQHLPCVLQEGEASHTLDEVGEQRGVKAAQEGCDDLLLQELHMAGGGALT